MSLDEQISALEGLETKSAEQYRAKQSILATLKKLKSIRAQFEHERPKENVVVSLLLDVLGEGQPKKGQKSMPT